jgi:carboxyl-terminal processing protease
MSEDFRGRMNSMRKTITTVVIVLLLLVSLTLGFTAGCNLKIGTTSEPELDVVNEVWQIVFNEYVEKDKLDVDTLRQGAIKGIIEALNDPYSSYLDTQAYQQSMNEITGMYEGIGAYVGMKDEQITIIAPIIGSPAEKAGIKAGDVIMEINGSSTSGLSVEEVVLLIRGPKGTSVRLLVLHEGDTVPEEIEVVRDEIELTSVYSEMKDDLAYIVISHFSERTYEELSSTLEDITGEGATGIILDLRSNPGGVLDAVVDVVGCFLHEGVALQVVDNEGNSVPLSVTKASITTDLPMVVLTDSYTASASEVLTGALQDYARATIAGQTTYGKGSVNTLYQLEDGSGLIITTHRWLTPNGRLIEGKGITPDYKLDEEEDAIQWAIDFLKGNK